MTPSLVASSGSGVITVFIWAPPMMVVKNSTTAVTPANIRMMVTSVWMDLFTLTADRAPV